ncbi:hypothetical protein [Pseudomonas fluorescens]|uniref:hypothetical protein n=1 Tax=Pseudomonas fluorescens TaxID=294 RepID=UPI001241E766|nr:hypothetical protein [Pseudomonas fluorescens]
MKNNSLELDVAEYVKTVDDIFERQLKLMLELRESFRLIAEAVLLDTKNDLPPLETIGINNNFGAGEASHSDVRKATLSPNCP